RRGARGDFLVGCARARPAAGLLVFFFFQAEDGIRDFHVTGVQTCALPISIVISVVPSLGSILVLAGLLPIVLLVFGVITAANEARKPIPIIGKIFEGMFNF